MKNGVIALVKNSIPVRWIAEFYKLNWITLEKHVPKKILEDARDFKEPNNKKKLYLLKILAWMLADEQECAHEIGTPSIIEMKNIFYRKLHLAEKENFISGIIEYKNIAERNSFSEGVSEGHRKLIEAIYPSPKIKKSAKICLEEILALMHKDGVFTVDEKDISISHADKILQEYIQKMFASTKENRYFDERFVAYLDELMDTMGLDFKKAEAIRSYFEIGGHTELTYCEKHGLVKQSMLNAKNSGMDFLQRRLNSPENNFLSLSAVSECISLRAELSETQDTLRTNEDAWNQKVRTLTSEIVGFHNDFKLFVEYLQLGKNVSPAQTEKIMSVVHKVTPEAVIEVPLSEQDEHIRKILRTPIYDLELSVRAYNCLKSKKINSLFELVQYAQEELMQIRFFGQKSLSEIEQVLYEHGLWFCMDVVKYSEQNA